MTFLSSLSPARLTTFPLLLLPLTSSSPYSFLSLPSTSAILFVPPTSCTVEQTTTSITPILPYLSERSGQIVSQRPLSATAILETLAPSSSRSSPPSFLAKSVRFFLLVLPSQSTLLTLSHHLPSLISSDATPISAAPTLILPIPFLTPFPSSVLRPQTTSAAAAEMPTPTRR